MGEQRSFWFPPPTGLESMPVHRQATTDEFAFARPAARGRRTPFYFIFAGVVAPLVAPFALGAEFNLSELWMPMVVVGPLLLGLLGFLWRFARDLLGARVTADVVVLTGVLIRTEAGGGGPHTHTLGPHRVLVPRPWFGYLTDRPARVEAVRVAVPSGGDTAIVVRAGLASWTAEGRRLNQTTTPAAPLPKALDAANFELDTEDPVQKSLARSAYADALEAYLDQIERQPSVAASAPSVERAVDGELLTLSIAREVGRGTPLVRGRWVFGAAAMSATSFFLSTLFALFASAGGYGGPDAAMAWGSLAWAAASLVAFAAFGGAYLVAERRMHRLYQAPGLPSAADFARARWRVVRWSLAVGPALMLVAVVLGLAPWWAALPVGAVAFLPIACLVPTSPTVSPSG